VVNCRFIKPLDEKMLTDILNMHIPILTVEEAALAGGFGSAVLEFAHDAGFSHVNIRRMGIPDRFIQHGSVKELYREIGLTPENIAKQMISMMEKISKRA